MKVKPLSQLSANLTVDVFVFHLLVALEDVACLTLIWPVDFNARASSLLSSIDWIELSSELLVFFEILYLINE